jgi:hypothetical protein
MEKVEKRTIVKVREELDDVRADLRSGSIELKDAAEIHNNVGKLLGTIKVQLEEAKINKEKVNVSYLHDGE